MKYIKLIVIFIGMCITMQAQEILEEDIELFNEKISLPGTLSYPKINGRLPLVIFVHGSGNVDRNGNQSGLNLQSNYIKQLADSLNKKNIAFYRYDKRTATPANLAKLDENIVLTDLVDDASLVIEYFSKDRRFKEIILIGHSQGSLTGMLALNKNVSKFISLAGASGTFGETLTSQISKQSKELAKIAQEHLLELMETDTIQNVNFMLQSIFKPFNHNFIKSYNSYKPTEIISKVNIPTLIINGSSDTQIAEEDAKKLSEAKPDARLVIIPYMNHVLKTVKNIQENQSSYLTPDFPLSRELIHVISDFINK